MIEFGLAGRLGNEPFHKGIDQMLNSRLLLDFIRYEL
jgi:hypothetical protein